MYAQEMSATGPQPVPDLDGLAPVGARDADIFVAACDQARARSYIHYFPFLHFYGSDGRLRWERHGDTVLVYQIRRRNAGGTRMTLYLPPMPFDTAALHHALERMQHFNKSKSARINWVAEEEVPKVARAGFSVFFKMDEFIYDRSAVMKLEGSGFSRLRRELSGALRTSNLEIRPYRPADEPACLAVLEDWEERMAAAGIKLTVGGYATRACLAQSDRFAYPLLTGMVAEIEGEVRGFAFGGRLSSEMGCAYLFHTDPRFPGLPELLRYRLMEAYPDLACFNDSGDSGRKGLQQLKQQFRPVEMHGRFGAQMN